MGRGTAWIGIVVFAVAWFVPVHDGLEAPKGIGEAMQDLANDLGKAMGGMSDALHPSMTSHSDGRYSGPPGWQAFRAAWDMLTNEGGGERSTQSTLLGLTSVTNGVMVIALLALLLGAGSGTLRGLGLALLACAVLNLGWYLWSEDKSAPSPTMIRDGLKAGYWLWLASFAVVGVSLLRPGPSSATA